ncbi:hypothetical protein [Vibrio sp. FF145]|uniref:hypothetical protein n=1 Tax=Vibrio sp. FF145 TaxID=3230013 RepID=UPI00352BF875
MKVGQQVSRDDFWYRVERKGERFEMVADTKPSNWAGISVFIMLNPFAVGLLVSVERMRQRNETSAGDRLRALILNDLIEQAENTPL